MRYPKTRGSWGQEQSKVDSCSSGTHNLGPAKLRLSTGERQTRGKNILSNPVGAACRRNGCPPQPGWAFAPPNNMAKASACIFVLFCFDVLMVLIVWWSRSKTPTDSPVASIYARELGLRTLLAEGCCHVGLESTAQVRSSPARRPARAVSVRFSSHSSWLLAAPCGPVSSPSLVRLRDPRSVKHEKRFAWENDPKIQKSHRPISK